jgi:hypothetical protein
LRTSAMSSPCLAMLLLLEGRVTASQAERTRRRCRLANAAQSQPDTFFDSTTVTRPGILLDVFRWVRIGTARSPQHRRTYVIQARFHCLLMEPAITDI